MPNGIIISPQIGTPVLPVPNFAGGETNTRRTVISALVDFVDGYPERSHKLTTSIGSAPVETGARISDHAIPNAEEVILTGLVSDLKLDGISQTAAAWERIRELQRNSDVVELMTSWASYAEMIIVEVTANEAGGGMRFTMKLEEILRVGITQNVVEAPLISGPAVLRTSNVDRGLIEGRRLSTAGQDEFFLSAGG